MDNLAQLEWEAGNLRHQVSLANFSQAEAAAGRYAEAAAIRMRALPPAEAAETFRQSCELLEWARRNLCAARARLAGPPQSLRGPRAARGPNQPPPHRFALRTPQPSALAYLENRGLTSAPTHALLRRLR